MFSSLASYIFGNSSSDTDKQAAATKTFTNLSLVSDRIDVQLLSTESEEDDWLLVDKEEESLPRTDSEEELPFVEIKSPILQQPTRYRRNGSRTINDEMSQPLYVVSPSLSPGFINRPISSMEESWFLTPPPCFTSTGPINMESSPFENLLIEHPSMSVYHSIRSAQEAAESFVDLDLSAKEAKPESIVVRTTQCNQTTLHRVEIFTYQQAKQGILLRNSQKIHDKKERQNICRGALKRENKVRCLNSRGNRPRRSDMQHCKIISRANNNRKC